MTRSAFRDKIQTRMEFLLNLPNDWAYPVDYVVGNQVLFQGELYESLTDHTSASDQPPAIDTTDWVLITTPAVAYPTIWNDEGGPKINGPYFTLYMLATTRVGQSSATTTVDPAVDPAVYYKQDKNMTLSIQGYGSATEDQLAVAANRLESTTTTLARLRADGFVVRDIGDVKEVSTYLDYGPEKRFVIEVKFGYAERWDDYPGWVETINGSTNSTDLVREILPP